jgi:hypothetical protein
LPDELDPQVKEFAGQLRRLVDRSGLSIAALADRTGYSKTSWERYLNGRLLAPKGAIVALAEVTGTNAVHLTTMWELAERAWSRAEMRHDLTMEAFRISAARDALEESGASPAGSKGAKGGKAARRGGSATATPGIAGPAGVAPTVPPQPTAPEVRDSAGGGGGGRESGNSWGVAGYRGPSAAGAAAPSPSSAQPAPSQPSPSPSPSPLSSTSRSSPSSGAGASGGPSGGPTRKQRLTTFLAGVLGVLIVLAGVLFLMDGGGKGEDAAARTPSPSASTNPDLPPGVKCSGASCTGKDAESMGCSGDLVTTAETATVGSTVVEVRYSRTCRVAWGRITQAAQGDEVRVKAGGTVQTGSITTAGDAIAYTPMVAVKDAAEATACVTLASGRKGCTK